MTASEMSLPLTGGCQCGAVRYALHEPPGDPHICHCRMCQKAFGSFFAPLTGVRRTKFELTRGALSIFNSSDEAERGFCNQCGTPLTFSYNSSDKIAVSIGSLDKPGVVMPAHQYGIEGKVPYFADLDGLPAEITEDPKWAERWHNIRSSNRQHPDHETSRWHPGDTGRAD